CIEKAVSKLIGMAITVNQQYRHRCIDGATRLFSFKINRLDYVNRSRGGNAASAAGNVAACCRAAAGRLPGWQRRYPREPDRFARERRRRERPRLCRNSAHRFLDPHLDNPERMFSSIAIDGRYRRYIVDIARA
ncbi:MAG: hypothetical protein OER87_04305, partial [Gammaproteobacteria bacterium]|nr:hypothetical protein [Gammaproteobacteria bacterium]